MNRGALADRFHLGHERDAPPAELRSSSAVRSFLPARDRRLKPRRVRVPFIIQGRPSLDRDRDRDRPLVPASMNGERPGAAARRLLPVRPALHVRAGEARPGSTDFESVLAEVQRSEVQDRDLAQVAKCDSSVSLRQPKQVGVGCCSWC